MDFNSIKVQLELILILRLTLTSLIFQFHKGTIRTFPSTVKMPCYGYFNSIKVQLEPVLPLEQPKNKTFQFHKGTIRTHFLIRCVCILLIFQFHKGTIRTGTWIPTTTDTIPKFQFHKGTIRTIHYWFGLNRSDISIP